MSVLHVDLETYSSVDLKKSNVYAYTESPDFEILMCSWSLDGSPVVVEVGEKAVDTIPFLWDETVEHVAHNAGFERVCLSRLRGLPVGEYLSPEYWTDTAALAAEAGLPRKLEFLAKALGAEEKDSAGTRLINLFCMPHKGKRTMPEDEPEKWADFVRYCGQDTSTLVDIHRLLPDWPTETERVLWCVDQRINDRGVKVDMALARKAVMAAEGNTALAVKEVIDLSGIENPGSTAQMGAWTASQGCVMDNWQADTVTETLATGDPSPDVRRVLELRQELALVASNKYTAAIRGCSVDKRLRGQFVFFGAHTGRWSSKGVQVHNLPKKGFPTAAEQEAAILDLMYDFGATPASLKKLVRPLFTGPFAISDYSAIEARVLAWLAGEQWVLDAFADGRDLYVETANRMGGLTRAQGKIAVLALGYGGGAGSLRVMGAEGSDAELDALKVKWRDANPKIHQFWDGLHTALSQGGYPRKVGVGIMTKKLWVEREASPRVPGTSRLVLPSGRSIVYNNMFLRKPKPQDMKQWHKTQDNPKLLYYDDPVRGQWPTYGGRLCENVTQAVARDLLADSMIRLDRAGYRVVAHVHDEVVVESADIDGIARIMKAGPAWSEGLPLDASADLSERYTK